MNVLTKLRSCSPADVALLLRAAGVVFLVRLGLHLLPFNRLRGFVERPRASEASNTPETDRVVWAVRAIARRTLGDKPCLVQALSTMWMLRETGDQGVLRIGVKRENGEFAAHAWLERGGDIIIGGRSSPHRYVQMQSK